MFPVLFRGGSTGPSYQIQKCGRDVIVSLLVCSQHGLAHFPCSGNSISDYSDLKAGRGSNDTMVELNAEDNGGINVNIRCILLLYTSSSTLFVLLFL